MLQTADNSTITPTDAGDAGPVLGPIVDAPVDTPSITRVLVADSNPTVRKVLKHMFATVGWQSCEAADGEEALKIAQTFPRPQALWVDVQLPKINGYDVCSTLKQDERFQLLPIVLMTSEDSPEEKNRALEAGADDILKKPINRAEVTFRIRSLFRINKHSQELVGAESVSMALARAVAAKDGYSYQHVEQVATTAVNLGAAMGMDEGELKVLRYGAILHNVGKIGIPDAILEKTGALTPREKALFQQHPRVGCDLCAPLKPLAPVLPIIRQHKERWDGTGYPDGLKGDEIMLGAQIVGIVNIYCALTSDRPYRKAIETDEALAQLRKQAVEGWHNPELVEKFIESLQGGGEQEEVRD